MKKVPTIFVEGIETPPFKEGDRVVADYEDEEYFGKIFKLGEKVATVIFDDGNRHKLKLAKLKLKKPNREILQFSKHPLNIGGLNEAIKLATEYQNAHIDVWIRIARDKFSPSGLETYLPWLVKKEILAKIQREPSRFREIITKLAEECANNRENITRKYNDPKYLVHHDDGD